MARFVLFVASLALLGACTIHGSATPANPHAAAVTVLKTGGVAGVHKAVTDVELDADTRTQLLDLVSSREFTDLNYDVPGPCCDGFEYTVTVDYDSGNQKVVTAYDLRNDTPQVLKQVVALVKPILR
ncbi:protealysin inhibitor emfourin [Antrihabitans stalactiti]|uniref:Lipoprotein n=1 Tax=Antrihabitans stalactiti TaxID=2584121 RepID=A0A848KQY9_9NOCA|nr:protealysin inhibitor emfourin [Antrihabitans stalactiti]NMN98690.1 hypothetical protein [Antrihabitans stalactiti]